MGQLSLGDRVKLRGVVVVLELMCGRLSISLLEKEGQFKVERNRKALLILDNCVPAFDAQFPGVNVLGIPMTQLYLAPRTPTQGASHLPSGSSIVATWKRVTSWLGSCTSKLMQGGSSIAHVNFSSSNPNPQILDIALFGSKLSSFLASVPKHSLKQR
ncbi:hypothetical protein Cgig2_024503 [Carnegiea gigantea]|uniref:Uncharacterized protein n=1 Tax=Carnegiea gigantea TaxID=171969 RepID=A0A9Q1KL79_9CARY|nr:hypothetical protein Cgig2_024503 [Carnegiea gigantea]